MKRILRGEPIETALPLEELDRRVPSLSISTDPTDGPVAVSQRLVHVHVHVDEAPGDGKHSSSAGAKDVRLFENGILVKHWHGPVPGGHADLDVEVPISAGTNNFTAYAFNNANVKSGDAQTGLLGSASLGKKGRVYVLGIGINTYQDGIPALHYAAHDATAFVDAVAERQPAREVVKATLTDHQANRANILCAFSRLGNGDSHPNCAAEELNALRPAEPEDTVYILFSGHGLSDRGHFFILPSDSSTTKDFRVATSTSVNNMISDRDLQEAFEPILAREQAMVLDACGSGGLLGTNEKSFGPLNLDGFAQLAYEKGLYVLSAATAKQSAMEAPVGGNSIPHSILTYVLVDEALKKNKARYDPTKGISITDWFNYAVQHVPNEANQQPVAFYPLMGEDSKTMIVSNSTN